MSMYIHDDLLGYVPKPGYCAPGVGESFHTIGGDGLRVVDGAAHPEGAVILAVGDSYTYGDEVRDEHAWPAQLQKFLGRPVLNGGVTGYGFDQIVLRAEQLVARYRPSMLVASFIAHDVFRTEMSCLWWRNKPWFAIEGDQLVLKGVPVPRRKGLPPWLRWRLDRWLNAFPFWLAKLAGYHSRVHAPGNGVEISKRLIERLGKLGAEYSVAIMVVAQYPPITWVSARATKHERYITLAILDHAAKHGLATLDTFPRLATEPTPLDFYANAHMNPRGNSMIAALLAATLAPLLAKKESNSA